jgi:hypothetical protein
MRRFDRKNYLSRFETWERGSICGRHDGARGIEGMEGQSLGAEGLLAKYGG